jgi:putative glutamine transport system substrate-binding protein
MEIDMAYALAERIGLTADDVKFEAVTAKTRGPLLDNGQLDVVIATFTIKPERLEQWNFSQAYYQDEVGLLVKKSAGIAGLADLDGKVVGVAQGATSRDAVQVEADKAGIKVSFLEFATYPEINAALESGRVDAFSVDKSILSGYVTDASVILPDGFSPQDYGAAMKKGNDDLTDFFNEMLTEMESSGDMAALLTKWNLN